MFCLLAVVSVLVLTSAYKHGDAVRVQSSNVRPYNNPMETYNFYSAPLCRTGEVRDEGVSLAESLLGSRRRSSPYSFAFAQNSANQDLCEMELDAKQVDEAIGMIERDYIFELFVDDLPVASYLGEVTNDGFKTKRFLYSHITFYISHNMDQGIIADPKEGDVIAVKVLLSKAHRVELHPSTPVKVKYTYAVEWHPVNVPYSQRIEVHEEANIARQSMQVHWLSIINAAVLAVLLVTFLAIILMRVLKNDFSRYMDVDAEEFGAEIDDSGWKQVHGDVFRYPAFPMFFCAAIGTGSQLLLLSSGLLLLNIMGPLALSSTIISTFIALYALTSFVAGYVSSTLYTQFEGKKWATTALVTASAFSVPFICIFAIVNTTAISYGSTSAIPAKFVVLLVAIWLLVTVPLTVVGSSIARKRASTYTPPCRTNYVRREIPTAPWYYSWPVFLTIAGFLPFTSIYIEIHYLFASIWGNQVYTLFGILAIALTLLVAVTAFISVAMAYFQLSVEDYRWWWRSFANGGSVGIFVFAYAVFFFYRRSSMDGILQTTFFLGYVALFSYAFVLMLGTVGFASAHKFVRRIYSSIKSD